ncbi:MAG: MFS transporter [Chloroflexi bacterium]|nr:MFS transporter [Chloroflexota bacterium]
MTQADVSIPEPEAVRSFRAFDYLNISIFWFALSMHWNVLSPVVIPEIILRYVPEELKGTYLGIMMAVGGLVAMLVQPLIGAISDGTVTRWGRRRPYIVVGVFLDIPILISLLYVPNYAFFFLAVVGLQITANVAQGPYQALIPDLVPERNRGVASGFMGLMGVGGQIGGALLAAVLAAHGQTVLATIFIAAVMFALMLWTVVGVKEPTLTPITLRSFAGEGRPHLRQRLARAFVFDLRRYPDFGWFLISRFFVLLGVQCIINFAQYFLRDVVRLPNPAEATAYIGAIVAVGALLAIVPGGWLSDRVGRKRIIYLSCGTIILGVGLLLTAKSLLAVTAYAVLIGTAMGLFFSVDWALASDLVPKGESGKYMGFSNLATSGALTVAWFIGGPLSDYFNGWQHGLGYSVLFGTTMLYAALGIVTLRPVREIRLT